MEYGIKFTNGNYMAQFIEWFNSLGKVFGQYDFDTVDSNLVRYYRTEYGPKGGKKNLITTYTIKNKKRITMRK